MRIPEFLLSEPVGVYAPALAAWLLRRERLDERMNLPVTEGQLSISDFVNARRPYQVSDQGIAVIHANEVLSRTATNVDKLLGDTHYNDLITELSQAVDDDQVRGILLDISSPGGSAVGAPEAAQAVQDAAQEKPVVAYVETVGASAAYYFAAASNAIVASPSAIVGSIGTISMFPDISAMLERFGVKFNIITPEQSDLKATGNPFRAMTDAEKEFLQSRAESLNAAFTSWVQSHRPMVDDGTMRGQWFSGSQAIANGIVDQVGNRTDAFAALEALIAYSF
jgi:protease-4